MTDDYKRAQSIVGTNNDGGRPENDFYPTPPEGTNGLLKYESFIGDIWEPACGDGAMSKVLEAAGYKVISTDVEPRNYGTQGDFFFYGSLLAPNVVTNPPFRLAQEFADRALALGCDKLAFSERLSMSRNGEPIGNGGMIAFAWFVWERGYIGRPMIGWI